MFSTKPNPSCQSWSPLQQNLQGGGGQEGGGGGGRRMEAAKCQQGRSIIISDHGAQRARKDPLPHEVIAFTGHKKQLVATSK
jgi:hypothetical protein